MARRCGECWVGVACEYCGRVWEKSERRRVMRYDMKDDSIVCARGFGCARRRPEHERVRMIDGRPRSQYLLDGHWYTRSQLADLAEVDLTCVTHRLRNGWTVADAVALRRRGEPHLSRLAEYKRLRDLALKREGGTPLVVHPTTKRGRPRKYSVDVSEMARRFGLSSRRMYFLLKRDGYQRCLKKLLASSKPANNNNNNARRKAAA